MISAKIFAKEFIEEDFECLEPNLNLYQFLMIPIGTSSHWLLVYVNHHKMDIIFYDSLATQTSFFKERLVLFMNLITRRCSFPLSSYWTFQKLLPPTPSAIISDDIPLPRVHQEGIVDCGVFCCAYAYHIATNKTITFKHDAILDFRFKILQSILLHEIIDLV